MSEKVDLFFFRGCTTCRSVKAWLQQQEIELATREFFVDRFSESELRTMIDDRPVSDFFSWSSPRFRKLGLAREELDDDRLLAMMIEEPRLIRRPLIAIDGAVLNPVSGGDRIIEMLKSLLG